MSFKQFEERSAWVLEVNRLCREEGWTLIEVPESELDFDDERKVTTRVWLNMLEKNLAQYSDIIVWLEQHIKHPYMKWNREYAFESPTDATLFALRWL